MIRLVAGRTAWRALVLLSLAAMRASAQRSPRDTVDIGFEDAAAPWSQPDGTGYVNDLVIAAFRSEGIAVRKHVLPYARCKELALSGGLVGCISMSPESGLGERIRFSRRALFTFSCSFFERRGHPLPRRVDSLKRNTVVGIVLGYEYPPELLRALRARGARLEAAPSEEVNLRKLARGRIDAAVVNRDEVKSPFWVATHAGVQGEVGVAFTMGQLPGYAGFSLERPDGRALAERFDRGYDRIIATGEAERIKQHWIALGLQRGR